MGIRYQPPRGFKLVSEVPGPPAVAVFSSDLEIRSIPAATTKIDAAPLAELLAETFAGAKMPAPGRIISAKTGTLPAGPVVRYELERPGERSLVYLIPDERRRVVVSFSASESRYRELATRVETSLASLRLVAR
jgi:hypothetical protein